MVTTASRNRRSRTLLRSVAATLLGAALSIPLGMLAGCGGDTPGQLSPAPLAIATLVSVRDAHGAAVAGASVFAIRLDAGMLAAAATDAGGLAHFTLDAGRYAVSTIVGSGAGLAQVAGSTGRVRAPTAGAPDTVLFRLQLATESFAEGHVTVAGQTNYAGSIVTAIELPELTTTDVTGAWRLAGLPPGLWTGTATRLDSPTAVFDIVVPAPDDTVAVATVTLHPVPPPAARATARPAQNWK